MQKQVITLDGTTLGTQYCVTALHFEPEGSAHTENTDKISTSNPFPKIYVQASLHADEMPGSLVTYYLHERLLELEAQGRLKARVTLVPLCNPIGLNQMLDYQHIGRFHLVSGQNFNRLYTVPLYDGLLRLIQEKGIVWSSQASANTVLVRDLLRQVLASTPALSPVESLHKTLLSWAYDADLVLDLHCDNHAVMHLYTLPSTWNELAPLAAYLGSHCQILSEDSGTCSFDEMVSLVWSKLQQAYPTVPFEQACVSATVEFRGEYDLSHEKAAADAEAILQYWHVKGYIELVADQVQVQPALINPPFPLGGMHYIKAPCSGIAVYRVQAGDWVEQGQPLIDIMDPISLHKETLYSPARGIVFAHGGQRVARPERTLLSLSSPDDRGHIGLTP